MSTTALHELNSDLETVTLNCAEAIAEYVHFGQKDKQGRPYIEHVQRVAKACRNLSLDQRIASILHDGPEDHPDKLSLESVANLFGKMPYDLLWALTRQKGEDYFKYIDRVISRPLAIPIKLADLTDNLDPTRGPIPDSLHGRYADAALKLIDIYTKSRPALYGTPLHQIEFE